MGDVVRRDDAVAVRARRAERTGEPPAVVAVPGMGAAPPPPADVPPAAGGVQNVIYVAVPQAAAAPPPPQEVHHHHHHTTEVVYTPVRRRRLGKSTSFLGTLGLVVGGLACAMAFLPQVAAYAGWVAEAGLLAAGLAWVAAVLFRRTGATMPLAGLLVSAVGWAAYQYNTGQAHATYDRLRAKSPVALPAVTIPRPAAPVTPTATPPAAVPQPTPQQPASPPVVKPVPATPKHEPSIFDFGTPVTPTTPAAGH